MKGKVIMNSKKVGLAAVVVLSICLGGCGKKEATPDTAGNTPGPLALKILKLANEGKFDEVKKLMTADHLTKIESGKIGPQETVKDYFDLKTKNQTITNMEVLEEGPGKRHPWKVDVKAHYKDGSSISRIAMYFKLEDGLWMLMSGI